LIDEQHSRVLDALGRLPPRQGEAVVARFYLELPASEIARSMGVSRLRALGSERDLP
jgi:DNA-directed RNA polymerase specialized sigma24 family protein